MTDLSPTPLTRAELDQVLYATQDPTKLLHDNHLPAMTTLLFQVCGNDGDTFEEATRLIELFAQKAADVALNRQPAEES